MIRPNSADTTTPMVWLQGVTKHYGTVVALDEIDLEVRRSEFLTLLGPSGSGKTTILNLISGMVGPTAGRIWIDGKDITEMPPNKRGLGMVFQNYALMPHMTVFENIAFPLRVRKLKSSVIKTKVAEVLDLVRLPEVARRKPSELSGGQQQRIAIARCLVYNPSIILMDEPLGALDKKLREEMQLELKRLHASLDITAIYVTHDQEEALTMSDRIVLLNNGQIEQMGTPDDLYFHPRSLFSAEFLGDSNILSGNIEETGPTVTISTAVGQCRCSRACGFAESGTPVKIMVRPENVFILPPGTSDEHLNKVPARMVDTITFGGVIKSYLQLADGSSMVVQELTRAGQSVPEAGSEVYVAWSSEDTIILPVEGRIEIPASPS